MSPIVDTQVYWQVAKYDGTLKGKGSPHSITGFRSWSRFLAVSLQVTWVINPAVDCHYLKTFRQACSYPRNSEEGCYQFFSAWWTETRETRWVWTVCLRLLPDSVAAAIWTRALLRLCAWVQHAHHSATGTVSVKKREVGRSWSPMIAWLTRIFSQFLHACIDYSGYLIFSL